MTYSDTLLDKAIEASASVPEFWTRLNLDDSGEGLFEVGWSGPGGADEVLVRTTNRAEAMRIRDRLTQRAAVAAVLLSAGYQEP